jgi:hypothetical protein
VNRRLSNLGLSKPVLTNLELARSHGSVLLDLSYFQGVQVFGTEERVPNVLPVFAQMNPMSTRKRGDSDDNRTGK